MLQPLYRWSLCIRNGGQRKRDGSKREGFGARNGSKWKRDGARSGSRMYGTTLSGSGGKRGLRLSRHSPLRLPRASSGSGRCGV